MSRRDGSRNAGRLGARLVATALLVAFGGGGSAAPAAAASVATTIRPTPIAPAATSTPPPASHIAPGVATPLTLVNYDTIEADGEEVVQNWDATNDVRAELGPQSLDVSYDDNVGGDTVSFSAPAPDALVVGMTYTGALDGRTDSAPGLWHFRGFLNCVSSFTIHDWSLGPFDGDGNPLLELSISFEEVCPGSGPNFGEIRLNSMDQVASITTDAVAPTIDAPVRVVMPWSVPGRAAAASLSVLNTGSAAMAFGTPVVTHLVDGTWTITGNTCSAAPLGPGDSCTIALSFLSWSPIDDEQDSLTVPLSTDRGSLFVSLSGDKVTSDLVPLTPNRVVDSRSDEGLAGPLHTGIARTFSVTDRAPGDLTRNVPADALAVVGNLTVTGQTAPGYLALTTDPINNPTTSSLNFADGHDVANGVVVRLGAGGTLGVTYFSSVKGSTANVVFDVTAYYAGGPAPGGQSGAGYDCGGIRAVSQRVLDTRSNLGLSGPFQAGVPRALPLALPGTGMSYAVALYGNLTVVSPTKGGYLAITPEVPTGAPATSTLNFQAGDTRANNFVSLRGTDGSLTITYVAPAGATAQVVLDLDADCDMTGGAGFVPLNPGRIADSRINLEIHGPVKPSTPVSVLTNDHFPSDPSRDIPGNFRNIPAILGFIGNVTMVAGTGGGYITIAASFDHPPTVSNVNAPANVTRANGFAELGSSGFQMFLWFGGGKSARTQVVLDLAGYFYTRHSF